LSPVTVEAIELIRSLTKIISCELFSHVDFATLPIPRRCTYLDSIGKFGFRA